MTEQENPTVAPVENPVPEPPSEKGAVPYDRFSEVVGEKNQLKADLAAIQDQLNAIKQEKADAEEAKRVKAGKAEEVIAELKGQLGEYQQQAEAFQKAQAQRLDALREKLPEDKRDKYAHIVDVNLLESLVDDLANTGGGGPSDRPAVPKEDFGGYGSYTEWANKDMKGYSEYMKAESETAIKWGVVPE